MRELLPVDAHKTLTDKIIGGEMAVSNTLGIGFLGRVYENALDIELEVMGLAVEQQILNFGTPRLGIRRLVF